MRTTITMLLCMFGCASVSIHAQQVAWLKAYAGRFSSGGMKLAPDIAGNVYGAGIFYDNVLLDGTTVENDWTDIVLAKWNSSGALVWARALGGDCPFSDKDGMNAPVHDPQTNEFLVTGNYNTTMIFGEDTLWGHVPCQNDENWMYLARFNSDGEFLWARHASGNSVGASVTLSLPTGEVDVFGACMYGATFHGTSDIDVPNGGFHARYSSTGELLSANRIITNGFVAGAVILQGQDAVLTGAFQGPGELLGVEMEVPANTQTWFLSKVDLGGGMDWFIQIKSSNDLVLSNCVKVGEKIIILGSFYGNLILPWDTITISSNIYNGFIACFDLEGEFQWLTLLADEMGANTSGRLTVDDNDNVLVCGQFKQQLTIGGVTLEGTGSNQGFVARFDTLGVCRSAWGFGKTVGYIESATSMADGVYVSCLYDSTLTFADYTLPHPGGMDRYLMVAKLDSLSGFTGIPPSMTLNGSLNIYANPNNGLCTVELPSSLRPSPDLLLSIYDNTGRLVQRTHLVITESGVQLDIRAQARGVYHVEVGDGRQRYTGRIVFE